MTEDKAAKCLQLLLAIAFDSGMTKEQVQLATKNFLNREIDTAEVATAAGVGIDFSDYLD